MYEYRLKNFSRPQMPERNEELGILQDCGSCCRSVLCTVTQKGLSVFTHLKDLCCTQLARSSFAGCAAAADMEFAESFERGRKINAAQRKAGARARGGHPLSAFLLEAFFEKPLRGLGACIGKISCGWKKTGVY